MNSSKNLGGKGQSLVALREAGFPVPRFVILSSDLFWRFLAGKQTQVAALLADMNAGIVSPLKTAEAVHSRLESIQILDDLVVEIQKEIIVGRLDLSVLAVRSSALGEDGVAHSFAGQYDTYLNVKGQAALLDSIRGCWLSKFSARSLEYAYSHGLDPMGPMAIIIQEMVNSRVSGVMFTANPMSCEPDQFVISAAEGLGEGIVSGKAECDEWTLDQTRKGRILSERLADSVRGACLTRREVKQLFELGEKIEKCSKYIPQDIEWAFADQQLFVLQSRPVTTFNGIHKNLPKQIWDSSNIGESYIHTCTPLTLSFVQRNYQRLVETVLTDVGVNPSTIAEMRQTTQNLTVPYRGYLYYRLDSWYSLFEIIPGGSVLKTLFSGFIGSPVAYQQHLASKERFGLLRGLGLLWRVFGKYRSRKKNQIEFEERYFQLIGQYSMPALNSSSESARRRIQDFHNDLFKIWKEPSYNDLFSVLIYGLCKILFLRLNPGKNETDLQKVFKLGQSIDSLGSIRDLDLLKTQISTDLRAKEKFLESSVQALVADYRSGKLANDFDEIDTSIRKFIKKWQYRGVDELKLESANFSENPAFVFENIQADLRDPSIPDTQLGRQVQSRESYVSGRGFFHGLMCALIQRSREALTLREKYRVYRGEIFGITRMLALQAGKAMQTEGFLKESNDVFYLTLDELYSNDKHFELVENRKTELVKYSTEAINTRFYVYGETKIVPLKKSARSGEGLWGESCFDGEVVAEYVNFHREITVEECRDKVLILKNAEPGHVIYFRNLKGLLIEKGSLLSHCVIAARELGIPLIIGVEGISALTIQNHNSGSLRMCGKSGKVTLCST